MTSVIVTVLVFLSKFLFVLVKFEIVYCISCSFS